MECRILLRGNTVEMAGGWHTHHLLKLFHQNIFVTASQNIFLQKIFVKYIFGRKPKQPNVGVLGQMADASGTDFGSYDDHYKLQQMAR